MTDLPPGWALGRLVDVADWGSGGTPKSGDPRYYGGAVPWAVIGDLNDSIVSATAASITNEGLLKSAAKVVPAGTILIAMYGSIGKLGITGVPMATNQAIAYARPRRELIETRFLFWFLRHERQRLVNAGKGATQKNIGQGTLKDWTIGVPPLAEQRRIVATLDHHLSCLSTGSQSVQYAASRLSSLRTSVLDRLSSGRLLPGLDLVPTQLIRDVAEVSGGIQKQPKRTPVKNRYPFLRVANVGRGVLDLTEVHEVELFPGELDRFLLIPGDLLVVEGNGSPAQIGRGARWSGQIDNCVHQNHLIRIRPGPDLLPEFLELAWNSPAVAGQLRDVAGSTSGLYTLSTAKVGRIQIPCPPISTQEALIGVARDWDRARDGLGQSLSIAESRSDLAQRSVLRAAFTGQLVPQDPDDETASLLLGRIRVERVQAPRVAQVPTKKPAQQSLIHTKLGVEA